MGPPPSTGGPHFPAHIWGLHTPWPYLSPQMCCPHLCIVLSCSWQFMLKSTCTLNLTPGNYLCLRRNGKMDYATGMQQDVVARDGQLKKTGAPEPRAHLGVMQNGKGKPGSAAILRDGQNRTSSRWGVPPSSKCDAKEAKLTARSCHPCLFLPPSHVCRWHFGGPHLSWHHPHILLFSHLWRTHHLLFFHPANMSCCGCLCCVVTPAGPVLPWEAPATALCPMEPGWKQLSLPRTAGNWSATALKKCVCSLAGLVAAGRA